MSALPTVQPLTMITIIGKITIIGSGPDGIFVPSGPAVVMLFIRQDGNSSFRHRKTKDKAIQKRMISSDSIMNARGLGDTGL